MRGGSALWVAAWMGLAVSGCGAAATTGGRAADRTLMSDGDWYREAIEDAITDYRQALGDGGGEPARCFDALLVRALAERGLTTRGLDVYTEHHPEFAAVLRDEVRPRLEELRRTEPSHTERAACDLLRGPRPYALSERRARAILDPGGDCRCLSSGWICVPLVPAHLRRAAR